MDKDARQNGTPAEKAVEELSLALMYLTKYSQKNADGTIDDYTMNEYQPELLNEFSDLNYIQAGSKTIYLTPEGIDKALEILDKYNITGYKID